MYFKLFTMSVNLESQLKRAGFQANSYEEVSSYVYVNGQVEQSIEKYFITKDFTFDGSLWREVDLIPYYERFYCLMRQPEMSFNQLWEIYSNTSYDDDEIGSISVILNRYCKELLSVLVELTHDVKEISKKKRKKIKKISNLLKSIDESIYTKQIVETIDKLHVFHTSR